MKRVILNAYVETRPAPTWSKGVVVILDMLSRLKRPDTVAILKDRDAWFLFMPPNSLTRDGALPIQGHWVSS